MSEKGYILVIDDDNVFRQSLVEALTKEGYTAEGVEDGFEALAKAKDNPIDLIVSDVRLPKNMDGIEAARKIKEMHEHLDTRVIIVTGYDDSEAPVRAIKIGADNYMYKPFDLNVFLAQIEKSMEALREKRKDRAESQ